MGDVRRFFIKDESQLHGLWHKTVTRSMQVLQSDCYPSAPYGYAAVLRCVGIEATQFGSTCNSYTAPDKRDAGLDGIVRKARELLSFGSNDDRIDRRLGFLRAARDMRNGRVSELPEMREIGERFEQFLNTDEIGLRNDEGIVRLAKLEGEDKANFEKCRGIVVGYMSQMMNWEKDENGELEPLSEVNKREDAYAGELKTLVESLGFRAFSELYVNIVESPWDDGAPLNSPVLNGIFDREMRGRLNAIEFRKPEYKGVIVFLKDGKFPARVVRYKKGVTYFGSVHEKNEYIVAVDSTGSILGRGGTKKKAIEDAVSRLEFGIASSGEKRVLELFAEQDELAKRAEDAA